MEILKALLKARTWQRPHSFLKAIRVTLLLILAKTLNSQCFSTQGNKKYRYYGALKMNSLYMTFFYKDFHDYYIVILSRMTGLHLSISCTI